MDHNQRSESKKLNSLTAKSSPGKRREPSTLDRLFEDNEKRIQQILFETQKQDEESKRDGADLFMDVIQNVKRNLQKTEKQLNESKNVDNLNNTGRSKIHPPSTCSRKAPKSPETLLDNIVSLYKASDNGYSSQSKSAILSQQLEELKMNFKIQSSNHQKALNEKSDEIRRLNQEILSKTNVCEKMHEFNERLKKDAESREANEIILLKEKLETVRKSLEKKSDLLESKNLENDRKASDYQNKLMEKKLQIRKLLKDTRATISSLEHEKEREIGLYKQKLIEATNTVQKFQESIRSLQKDHNNSKDLEAKIKEMKEALESARNENQELKTKHLSEQQEHRKEYSKKIQEIQARSQSSSEKMMQELHSAKQKIDSQQKKLANFQKKIEKLSYEAGKETVKSEIHLQRANEDFLRRLDIHKGQWEAERNDLVQMNQSMASELKTLIDKDERWKSECHRLKTKFISANQHIQKLESEIKQATKSKTLSEKKTAEISAEITKVRAESEKKLQLLKKEKEKIFEENTYLQSQNDKNSQSTSEMKNLKEELERIKKEYQELKQIHEESISQKNKSEQSASALRQKLEHEQQHHMKELETIHYQHKTTTNQCLEKIATQRDQITEQKNELTRLTDRIAKKESKNVTLVKEIDALRATIKVKEQDSQALAMLSEYLPKLQTEFATKLANVKNASIPQFSDANENALVEKLGVKGRIEGLKLEVTEKESQMKSLRSKIKEQQLQLQKCRESFDVLKQKFEKELYSLIHDQEDKVQEGIKEREKLAHKVKLSERKEKELYVQLDSWKSKYDSLYSQYSTLQQKNGNLLAKYRTFKQSQINNVEEGPKPKETAQKKSSTPHILNRRKAKPLKKESQDYFGYVAATSDKAKPRTSNLKLKNLFVMLNQLQKEVDSVGEQHSPVQRKMLRTPTKSLKPKLFRPYKSAGQSPKNPKQEPEDTSDEDCISESDLLDEMTE